MQLAAGSPGAETWRSTDLCFAPSTAARYSTLHSPASRPIHPLQEGADDPGDDEVQDPASFSSFYGHWQTVAYEPPAARDGIVPKNERGNVEVPPLNKLMPRGTVRGELEGEHAL